MKVSQVTNQIILVEASPRLLGDTFMRFQEHYESPRWKDLIFTVGQFKDWYSRNHGASTYANDWSGYNIPSYVLNPFKSGLFDPLTKEEQEFLELFRYRTDKFYIIGVPKVEEGDEDTTVLDHEIAHGLWYTNPEYQKVVKKYIDDNKDDFTQVLEMIKRLMYHHSVWEDEVHAYCIGHAPIMEREGVKIDKEHTDTLRAVFESCLKRERDAKN